MPGVMCSASLHRRHAAQHSCVHTNHLSMQMGLQTSSATIATFLLVLASFAGGAWDAGPALTLALFCLDVLRFWPALSLSGWVVWLPCSCQATHDLMTACLRP
jgi:hypothetical protein